MKDYGHLPEVIGREGAYDNISLPEVMYYLYLPVFMHGSWYRHSVGTDIRLPRNVECCLPLILDAMERSKKSYQFVYLSARKGWATPDNPLNRPGWHCDGFGTDDMNYVWWKGAGTRIAHQPFHDISDDDTLSLLQFERQVHSWMTYAPGTLVGMDPFVVHATPLLEKGEMRQYIKVSFSNHRYNLYNNSHNWLFDYEWEMVDRELVRNNTHSVQKDFA